MKKMVLLTTILLLFTININLSSCKSSSVNNNDFPVVSLSRDMMNKMILLEDLPEFRNSYKNNDILLLHVKNLSESTFVFNSDSSTMIFTKNEDSWISVTNSMHNPSEIWTLPPKKVSPPGLVIGVSPSLSDMVDELNIRIVLIGHSENADDQLVGAYLDITLLP